LLGMSELAFLIIGIVAGWGISHVYYRKSTADLHRQIADLTEKVRPRNRLEDFESRLDTSQWTEEFVGDTKVWVCADDATFQITRSNGEQEPFDEPWIHHYPADSATSSDVHLKINGNVIRQIRFITVDGGRIYVPMPEQRVSATNEREYYWVRDRLTFKVGTRIGSFYIYKTMEGVAAQSKIQIVNSGELASLDSSNEDSRLGTNDNTWT
jgi:hypothetical protein